MALRTKFYRLQTEAIASLMLDQGPGHWSILGPRGSDARVLVIHRLDWRTLCYLVSASGVVSPVLAPQDVDPAEFGARVGVSLG